MMSRSVLLSVLLVAGVSPTRAAERPHIVLMMADDVGTEALGCYGGLSYATPHLDRLAAGGLLFHQAYAQPLCSNTRVELMTGRRAVDQWDGFGLLRPEAVTFADRFAAAGSATSLFGKWQLFSYDPPTYPGAADRRSRGTRISEAGFDDALVFHAGQTEDKGSRYADPTLTRCQAGSSEQTRTAPGRYGPQLVADAATAFVRQHANDEQPFLLYYPMILPHWPMTPAPQTPAWQYQTRRHEADVRHFPGMVEAMDTMVGRLVTTLEEAGIRERTLLLFYSDNGTHQDVASLTDAGWKLGGKGLMTDDGTHVPLIASWPGTIAAGTTDALVGPLDFVPTLLDVAGIASSDENEPDQNALHGVSFAPVLRGEAGRRQTLRIDFEPRPGWDKDRFRHQIFVRDTRWKLYDDGRLYDLESDPRESRPSLPASDSEESKAVRDRLSRDLQ